MHQDAVRTDFIESKSTQAGRPELRIQCSCIKIFTNNLQINFCRFCNEMFKRARRQKTEGITSGILVERTQKNPSRRGILVERMQNNTRKRGNPAEKMPTNRSKRAKVKRIKKNLGRRGIPAEKKQKNSCKEENPVERIEESL